MQITNIDARITFDGGCELLLTVPRGEKEAVGSLLEEYRNKTEKPWEAVISVARQKRVLDANAKAWALLGKLAKELSKEQPISAEELYRNLIPDVTEGQVIPVKDCAVERWIYNWEHSPKDKIGWISKSLGKSKLVGYTNTVNWYGSSCFDTVEMHKLLTLIIQECKQYGIETLSPAELERLVQLWK